MGRMQFRAKMRKISATCQGRNGILFPDFSFFFFIATVQVLAVCSYSLVRIWFPVWAARSWSLYFESFIQGHGAAIRDVDIFGLFTISHEGPGFAAEVADGCRDE